MSTFPWAFSNAGQSLVGWLPSAMFTPVIRSEMLTVPVPPQSPTHGLRMAVGVLVAGAVLLDEAVRVAVAVVVGAEVLVGVVVTGGVVVGVAVVVALGVAGGVGEGVGVRVGVADGGTAPKFAVTVWGWSIVTVVEALVGSATAPVQLRKT